MTLNVAYELRNGFVDTLFHLPDVTTMTFDDVVSFACGVWHTLDAVRERGADRQFHTLTDIRVEIADGDTVVHFVHLVRGTHGGPDVVG